MTSSSRLKNLPEHPSAIERVYPPLYQKYLQVPSVRSEYHAARGDPQDGDIRMYNSYIRQTCNFYTDADAKTTLSKKNV